MAGTGAAIGSLIEEKIHGECRDGTETLRRWQENSIETVTDRIGTWQTWNVEGYDERRWDVAYMKLGAKGRGTV